MINITFIEHDGTAHKAVAEPGSTLMRAAKDHGIDGILADCGGCCVCGTCHVYIEPPWQAALATRTEIETATIEFASEVRKNSRLACQITLTEALEGLTVRLPESQ